MSETMEPSLESMDRLTARIQQHSDPFRRLITEIGKAIVGQENLIHRMLIGLLTSRPLVDRRGSRASALSKQVL